MWLAPVHAKLLPVADRFLDYALCVKQELAQAGVRADIDDRSEKLGYKIRQAQLEKVPYMLIVGEQEQAAGTAAVRRRGEGDLGAWRTDGLIARINEEIRAKR